MPSPAVYRRRRLVALLILATVVCVIWFSISSFSNGNLSNQAAISTTSGTESQDFTQPGEAIFLPSEGSSAVGISDLGVIATNGVSTPVPIASIAKTITTLVILNKLAPEYGQAKEINITFDQQDVEIRASTIAENGASQPVSDGLSMSLHDALAVMMLASANNYATSLAIKTFGSMDAYILAANDWLKANGLNQTCVADASGLNPNTIGTASDLVILGLIAMDNQEVVDIVTSPEISVEGVGTIQNGNPMFGIDGVDGIKLGSTYEANNCLLYSKSVNIDGKEIRIVGVTLGLDEFSTIIQDAQQTLDQVSSEIEIKELIPAGTQFGIVTSGDGKQNLIVSQDSFSSIYIPGVQVIATPQINKELNNTSGYSVGEIEIQVSNSRHKIPLVIQ